VVAKIPCFGLMSLEHSDRTMPQDLSEVKEVLAVSGNSTKYVNKLLAEGDWVLLEVKIVESQRQVVESATLASHLFKTWEIIYVLGRIK